MALCSIVRVHAARAPAARTTVRITQSSVVLDNGYVHAEFSTAAPGISVLAGDFAGLGAYSRGTALGRAGAVTQVQAASGAVTTSSTDGAGAALAVDVARNDSTGVTVVVSGVLDCAASPAVNETWTLALDAAARGLRVDIAGSTVPGVASLGSVRHSTYARAASVYALYDAGVVQMMSAPNGSQCFASAGRLHRAYALGDVGGGRRASGNAVDVLRDADDPALDWGANETVLIGGAVGGDGGAAKAGMQTVVFGAAGPRDVWGACWASEPATPVPAGGASWHTRETLYPNDHDFPAGALPPPAVANLPLEDLWTHQVGIYGSPMGQLNNYDKALPGQIGTSLHHPTQAYGGNYNFFDPDSFISISAMVYSGDAYISDMCRTLVERSGAFMLPSGQIPHHFIGDKPTYVAISGATQTGPNIFWLEACLQIARLDDDAAWLVGYLPKLRTALEFLLARIDDDEHMVSAPGSLWIDVFRRGNFTSDSNPMMVKLLRDFAEAEHAHGNATNGDRLQAIAAGIAAAMDAKLWDTASDDHYVTQLNPDGTTVDMVDYDSNLLAIAWGVAPAQRAQAALKRLDAGHCMQAGVAAPTYVSEKWYGPDMCYGGNIGDSATSMGRIAWADAHARKAVGDSDAFDSRIMAPLQAHLLNYTWLWERFGCMGEVQFNRSYTYFEYPATAAILLREVRYGVAVDFRTVTVDPLPAADFSYHFGRVNVDYSSAAVRISVPGSGQRSFAVKGLPPAVAYDVKVEGPAQDCDAGGVPATTTTSGDGTATVTAPVGVACTLVLSRHAA